ncbi:MAG: hypothetical protein A2V62_00590 [Nitrospirae bacterium RBG_19FT_COMBO_58_9]|nr:MAG: hypothetical protein A2V62_00590 [Nitrospirae bacterium RBG_19FT_COMBO_58_9]
MLAFVKGLTPVAGGVPDKDMLKFSGAIGQADLQTMTMAIEEGCAGTRCSARLASTFPKRKWRNSAAITTF